MDIFSLVHDSYIETTSDHYATSAESNVESVEGGTMSAGRYVQWVREKVVEEKERAEDCFGTNQGVAEQVMSLVRDLAGAKQQEGFVRRGEFWLTVRTRLTPSTGRGNGAFRRGGSWRAVQTGY